MWVMTRRECGGCVEPNICGQKIEIVERHSEERFRLESKPLLGMTIPHDIIAFPYLIRVAEKLVHGHDVCSTN